MRSSNSAPRRNKRHHPFTAPQVAAVAASIGERYPVYELFTLFAAYTGLRAEELAGCEVGDLVITLAPNTIRAVVHVRRSKKRRGGDWVDDTLKSARTVPLPDWLAGRMRDYLETVHPHADEATAPLWPNRALGGARRRGCRAVAPLDFSEPVDPGAFYRNLLRPALEAVGLPASRPAMKDTPAVRGARLHDLRHTAATLWLSNGVHFMQASNWLEHSTFTLTLDVYGDYIPDTVGGAVNPLPLPPAPARPSRQRAAAIRAAGDLTTRRWSERHAGCRKRSSIPSWSRRKGRPVMAGPRLLRTKLAWRNPARLRWDPKCSAAGIEVDDRGLLGGRRGYQKGLLGRVIPVIVTHSTDARCALSSAAGLDNCNRSR